MVGRIMDGFRFTFLQGEIQLKMFLVENLHRIKFDRTGGRSMRELNSKQFPNHHDNKRWLKYEELNLQK